MAAGKRKERGQAGTAKRVRSIKGQIFPLKAMLLVRQD